MTECLFPPSETPAIAVKGEAADDPVLRIFCVGRNCAAHAPEMGAEVDREAPFYVCKTPRHLAPGASLPRPPGTEDFHHEMELFVADGRPVFGALLADAELALHRCGSASMSPGPPAGVDPTVAGDWIFGGIHTRAPVSFSDDAPE